MFFCLSPDKILVYGKVFRRNIEKRGGGAYQIDHVKKNGWKHILKFLSIIKLGNILGELKIIYHLKNKVITENKH